MQFATDRQTDRQTDGRTDGLAASDVDSMFTRRDVIQYDIEYSATSRGVLET